MPAETTIPGSDLEQAGMIEGALKTVYGNERTVRIVRNQLYDDREVMMGAVIAMTDITDNIEPARQVAYQQSHDALTKLPNRSRFLIQFDRMIKAIQNTEKSITVFFVTLDNFKKINDAMGHHADDKLLEMASKRLFDIMHVEDVVARGGEMSLCCFQTVLVRKIPRLTWHRKFLMRSSSDLKSTVWKCLFRLASVSVFIRRMA